MLNKFNQRSAEDKSFLSGKHYTTWTLIKTYWQSEYKFSAYLTTTIIFLMTILLVGIDVALNYWYNFFYNALQAYDKNGVIRLLGIFFIIASIYIVVAVYRYYISQLFGLRWRQWLTQQFINRWFYKRGYYYLENFDEKTDNPDQRIQEDINLLTGYSIDLSQGFVSAIATFFAFIYVLWQLSGTLHIPLGSLGTLNVPGYLVWVGVIYAFIGTYFTFKIGRPLIGLNFEQQRREATFRFAAVDVRSHSENVALYHGESHQKSILRRLFNRVLQNYYFIILRQKLLLWFTAGYNQASVILPLVVALPNYFNKVFLLGGLIQSVQAFGRVQDSLSFIINSYTRIAEWQAICQRLTTFANHIAEVEDKAEKENKLVIKAGSLNQIDINNVGISSPHNKPLLDNISQVLEHNKSYLIKGQSGIGKSTFIRAIAGIWPFAKGEVTCPPDQKILYLPQKPYMPIGTLEEAILFPNHVHDVTKEELFGVLKKCRLDHLIPRLRETALWSETLSPGEQQRIAFARLLLQKPDWVFMDESTSMLDLKTEAYLYQLLKSELPNCAIVSVGHRSSLEELHTNIIDMEKYAVNLGTS